MYIGYHMPEYVHTYIYSYIMIEQFIYRALYGSERTQLWNIQTFLMKLIEKKPSRSSLLHPQKKCADKFRWQITTVFEDPCFFYRKLLSWERLIDKNAYTGFLQPKIKAGSTTPLLESCTNDFSTAQMRCALLRGFVNMIWWEIDQRPYSAKAQVVSVYQGRYLPSHTLAIKKYTLA